MALDSRMILEGIQPAIAAARPVTNFMQGQQAGQQLMQGNLQNNLLMQQAQQQEALAPLQQRALEQRVAQGDRLELDQQDMQRMKSITFAAQDALLLPEGQRRDFLNKRLQKLKDSKIDSSDTQEALQMMDSLPPEQFESFLKNLVNVGASRGVIDVSDGRSAPVQFGAQQTFKDESGNLFFGTTKRNPSTGEVESVLAPIDGKSQPVGQISMAGSYGLTAEEKVSQIEEETTASSRASANEDARQGFIKQGLAARGMMPKTKQLLELNNAITTGKLSKAKKFMQDIFGVTDPDLGQFNALAGSLVLENIRALGANPTEGERQFLAQITPSLEQGGRVNEALLKDMLEVQKRQIDRAKWFSNNKSKTVEQYLLETETDDFTPSSSVDAPSQSNNIDSEKQRRLKELRERTGL